MASASGGGVSLELLERPWWLAANYHGPDTGHVAHGPAARRRGADRRSRDGQVPGDYEFEADTDDDARDYARNVESASAKRRKLVRLAVERVDVYYATVKMDGES